MLTLIKKKTPIEFYTAERCHIVELLNDDDNPDLSIARCRVEPGVSTQLHALQFVQEVYFVESGTGIMDDGQNDGFEVEAGDSVIILPDHAQRIRNTGTTDLIFVVACTPRFEPKCYINLEQGSDDGI